MAARVAIADRGGRGEVVRRDFDRPPRPMMLHDRHIILSDGVRKVGFVINRPTGHI